mmetsp:Transcript_4345/g.5358  ORF Transcript_4345/g.5358 Transcript_4345/m.5358 type:complete len:465 (-) Transcript_4345:168-1562(-)
MPRCACYPLEKDGFEYNHFIAENFGECLYSAREVSSFMVGMSSLLFWICCQTPQFFANYRRKSGKALSKWFLIEWFSGDALNLCGCILTRQLITQFATGVLFVVVDVTMLLQISYYSWIYNGPRKQSQSRYEPDRYRSSSTNSRLSAIDVERIESDSLCIENEIDELNNEPGATQETVSESTGIAINGRALSALAAAGASISLVVWSSNLNSSIGTPDQMLSNNEVSNANNFAFVAQIEELTATLSTYADIPSCEFDPELSDSTKFTGIVLGWISAIVYLNSRLPQLIKNYKRQSVEGLSWVMFFCAVMGNFTYGLGVVLRDSSSTALMKALPWLVGSLGTLFFDFFILLQFQYYSSNRRMSLEDLGSSGYIPLSEGSQVDDAIRESPSEGLFGMRSWTTSPLFKPRNRYENHGPRNHFSHGVLPSEASSINIAANARFSSIAQHIEEEESLRESGGVNRADSF